MRTQVTFDCADPHGQAAFGAQVYGSTVEDDRKPVEVDRLTGLGARLIDVQSGRGPTTYVLRGPDGNEFRVH
jgi:hypothetical protein